MSASRLILAVCLAALAVGVVVVCCTWGTNLDTTLLLRWPGSPDDTGLFARPWLAVRPTVAMVVALGIPVFLLTASVWVSGVCRPRATPA